MKGVLPKGIAEEVDGFIHIRKGVSLGRIERLGKKEFGLMRKKVGFRRMGELKGSLYLGG